MTVVSASVSSRVPGAPAALPPRPLGRRARRLPADWPLVALFVGYPLWWLIGFADLAGVIAAAVMAGQLVRRRRSLTVPRGFALWLLFVVWVVIGVAVLQVNAPGAVPGGSGTRYLTWAYRLAYYVAATVVLLYVGNMRSQLSAQRVCRVLSWMFVTIVGGGLLGMLLPHLDFPSLLEVVLPKHIAQIPFVRAQVHPTVAELQDVLGYENPRPSAPFAFSNTWGLNFACFLPLFVYGWCRKGCGWRRVAAPFVLLLGLLPVIVSLNRGLWLSLLVMVVFVAVQSALQGNLRMLAALAGAAVVVVAVLAVTSLGSTIEARVASQDNSNQARSNLGSLTIDSMATKSPIVGFGSTRNVQGNFDSIAGGATASCPHCSPPALGTQGRLWLVAFSQGFVGLALYLGFFVLQFLRHIRLRGGDVTVGLCVLLVQAVTLPIYDWSVSALFAVMIAIALLWRASAEQSTAASRSRTEQKLAWYAAFTRRHVVLICSAVLTGGIAGFAWQHHQTSTSATVSVLIPADPQLSGLFEASADSEGNSASEGDSGGDVAATTLDTEAQLLRSREIRRAVDRAVHAPLPVDTHDMLVTADPNTRILNVTFSATDPATATTAAATAADTLLAMRHADLQDARSAALSRLEAGAKAISHAVDTVDAASRHLRVAQGTTAEVPLAALRTHRDHLISEWAALNAKEQRVASLPLTAGRIVRPATVETSSSAQLSVPVTSGLAVGLLGGIACGGAMDALRSRRTRRAQALVTRKAEFRARDFDGLDTI
jgi:hypothetical protein